jgi:UDP-galactopyranose mutase
MPINLETINKFYGVNMTAEQAKKALFPDLESEKRVRKISLSDTQLSDFGKPLYEVFIEGYTAKQWGMDPEELPRETINRLPIRFDRNSDYFDDPWQGIPIDGYGNLARKMLDHVNIDVFLGIDYFEIKYFIPKSCHIIFTGPIDRFFDYRFGPLKWRSVRFEQEALLVGDYQGTGVVNYPEPYIDHTRIHEYRHYNPERSYPEDRTVIAREFPVNSFGDYNPTYPVNTKRDKEIFEAYKKEQQSIPNITFGGRLGTYSYLNMDETILNALQTYERLKEARKE